MFLFDAQGGTTSRPHCHTVDDPFGGTGKVITGEVVEKDYNKTTFLNGKGFFVVPPGWKGSVVLRVAVRAERKLRVALVSESGPLKSYYPELPAEGKWCEVVLPLRELSAKIKAGEKIVDISVWQLGGGKAGGLYVDHALLRGE